MYIPRSEHPNPQFQREHWQCLNGEWQFEIDQGKSGEARGLAKPDAVYSRRITVPFCPQSALSGIGETDFMYSVWYRREVELTDSQLRGAVLLHFGAVDYEARVFINGKPAASHRGGYVSFCLDITAFCKAGVNVICVNALDDERDPMIPRGKQSEEYFSHGCNYTRTTGIWQSVWLEFVPETRIESFKFYPDCKTGSLTVRARLRGAGVLTAQAWYHGREVGISSVASEGGDALLTLVFSETHLWQPGEGNLYDLVFTYGEDTVKSYCGLRSLRLDGFRFMINEKPVFQRLVLDQGFYPDGIYTAPSDAALREDIERAMACGFNGARLHEKIFEPRFLYHADRMGYLVWGEYPNWGLDHSRSEAVFSILPEWLEEIERDFNHPSIIGWCPFNETWDRDGRKQNDEVLRMVYLATKAADDTRPCIDVSGNFHVQTDIFDVHDYEQDPAVFRANYDKLMDADTLHDRFSDRQPYSFGMPVFISEYGGIQWSDGVGWGYGNAPKDEAAFIARYRGLTEAILQNKRMFGFCYTQLTDVEQERNGLYTYDRQPKFDPAVFYAINTQPAAIETE